MTESKYKKKFFITLAVIVILFGVMLISNFNYVHAGEVKDDKGNLIGWENEAEQSSYSLDSCLNGADAELYYLDTCPHCHRQIEDLGIVADKIPLFECSFNKERCDSKGVKVVPTWFINGKKVEGYQTNSQLIALAGCAK